jgi:hypothetical protein
MHYCEFLSRWSCGSVEFQVCMEGDGGWPLVGAVPVAFGRGLPVLAVGDAPFNGGVGRT